MPGPSNSKEPSSHSIRVGISSVDQSRKARFWKNPFSLFRNETGRVRHIATMIAGIVLLVFLAVVGLFLNREHQRNLAIVINEAKPFAENVSLEKDSPSPKKEVLAIDFKLPWNPASKQKQMDKEASPSVPSETAKATKKEFPAAPTLVDTEEKRVAVRPSEKMKTPKKETPALRIGVAKGAKPRPDETGSPLGPVPQIEEQRRKPKNEGAAKLPDTVKP